MKIDDTGLTFSFYDERGRASVVKAQGSLLPSLVGQQ
jgi:hypothetical protein